MAKDAYAELVNYFDGVVEQMLSEARQSGALRNPADVGGGREDVFRRFLERHLPRSCEVSRGGYLFDLQGRESRQIDVIVTSGPTPRFEMPSQGKAIAPLEGTVAVAEVKSRLDGERLHQALENFASIPRSAPEKAVAPYLKKREKEFWWDWPYKVVVGYDAIDKETLFRHLVEFYEANPQVPHECRPTLIYALGKYVMCRIAPGMKVLESDGSVASEQPEVGQYRWFDNSPDLIATAFMLTGIQERAFLANHMIWKYDQWISRLVEKITSRQS